MIFPQRLHNILSAILFAMLLVPTLSRAIQVTRPYGDPALTSTWDLTVWQRQTQPQSEANSQGRGNSPQIALLFNHQFQRLGQVRAFFGGTVIDGEMLFNVASDKKNMGRESTRWLFGIGGYASPGLLPDEVFAGGHRIDDESMTISRYGVRAMLMERSTWYETLFFVSMGQEKYKDTSRTGDTFVLPSDTSLIQYGISHVFDRRKKDPANRYSYNFSPDKGNFGAFLATYTKRRVWRTWGINNGTQFDDPNQRNHWRIALNLSNTVPQRKNETVTFHLRGAYGKNLDRLSAFAIGGATEFDRNPYRFRCHGYFFNEFLANKYYGYNIDYRESLGGNWVFLASFDHVFANIFKDGRFEDKATQIRGLGTGMEYHGLYNGTLTVIYGFGMDAVRDNNNKNHEFVVSYNLKF